MSKKPQRERAGARVVLVMLLVLALMLGGGYLAAYAAAQDKTPRGTTVADVPVGGQTLPRRGRHAALGSGVTCGGADHPRRGRHEGQRDPAEARARTWTTWRPSGRSGWAGSWDPVWLWNYYTGGAGLTPS